jgi:hypothetical protein
MTAPAPLHRTRLDRAVVNATVAFLGRHGVRGVEWDTLPRWAAPLVIVSSSALYGAVMASYNGFAGDRLVMVAYGAAKVPLLFLATMLLAVPSFYVINLLLGVGDHFRRVWEALVDFQLAVSLQLGALVPITLFLNLTNSDYRIAQAWSTLLFAGATWNARRVLARTYAPLVAENPVHRQLLRLWFVLYAFVGIQMGWDLRPFVGSPDMAVQFFRDDIGNAYLEIFRVLVEAVRNATF